MDIKRVRKFYDSVPTKESKKFKVDSTFTSLFVKDLWKRFVQDNNDSTEMQDSRYGKVVEFSYKNKCIMREG